MHNSALSNAARRRFIAGAAGLSATRALPLGGALLAAANAAHAVGDHKALVCVNLSGGNDQSNTVVPMGAGEYAAYAAARPTLALPHDQLLALQPAGYGGQPLGLHPSLAAIKPLFDRGRMALLANVGPLAQPMTKAQWNNGAPTVPVPFQLTSHSDQTGAWQTGLPDKPSATGWFGRIGDLTAGTYNVGSGVSIAMSVAGNNALQAGDSTIQYQLTTQGAVKVQALNDLYGSAAGATALRRLMTDSRSHLFENEMAKISARAIASEAVVSSALAGVSLSVPFPNTALGRQLQIVAKMIGARSALAQRRQLFFVQQGGYDFHDNLLNDQARLLRELAEALAAFNAAIDALGVAQSVTAFTTSEFGRALQHNGRGSDHGWGGHHFIMGGAVLGNRVYGTFPTVALGGPEDSGQGRLIPSTAVDEYAATLARWFGVADGNMASVVPNIGRFARRNLGFLA
ncbi:MAG TPA: DUF1501 domain-containing protein [Rubrivivax sp.]|jgi:uncharacterized protein (DUF1501 family)|nr:DUF1501 domain-containing protein [Rubrivivax sp.]